jgi:TRAP-type C4-dicarboxylate transport system permease small subunit
MLKYIRQGIEFLAAVLVLGLTFIVALQVFQRFVVGRSLVWPDEAAGLILVWITFVGAYLTSADDAHVRFRLVHDRLHSGLAMTIATLGDIAVIVFLLVMAYFSLPLIERTWDQRPITVPISKGFIYSIMPVMCMLMIVEIIGKSPLLLRLWMAWRPNPEDSDGKSGT